MLIDIFRKGREKTENHLHSLDSTEALLCYRTEIWILASEIMGLSRTELLHIPNLPNVRLGV